MAGLIPPPETAPAAAMHPVSAALLGAGVRVGKARVKLVNSILGWCVEPRSVEPVFPPKRQTQTYVMARLEVLPLYDPLEKVMTAYGGRVCVCVRA